ncbi:hypothetical protein SASPL_148216 [Salvia splendens]|uniref:Glycolipid transfer protein domain-containing protein n=1 Tax=Salvia splendens TaxID=180675 RepID=A0A8X8WAD3_SALSN|nr:hypothetical protein SASPL_148216 [Salvia splendens]
MVTSEIRSAIEELSLLPRLEKFHDSDPSIYWDVVEILKKEVNEGKAKKGPTCSKAFVWLNRSLEFALALLELLVKDFGRNMEEAVEQSYINTLKPWHGWISSAAYKVALKLVPDSRSFVDVLKVKGEEDDDILKKDIQNLVSLLMPVLEQNKEILSFKKQNNLPLRLSCSFLSKSYAEPKEQLDPSDGLGSRPIIEPNQASCPSEHERVSRRVPTGFMQPYGRYELESGLHIHHVAYSSFEGYKVLSIGTMPVFHFVSF